MKVIKNNLHIGVKEPFCVLHASDTHIAFADNRETERKSPVVLCVHVPLYTREFYDFGLKY